MLVSFASRHPIISNAYTLIVSLLIAVSVYHDLPFWPCAIVVVILNISLSIAVDREFKKKGPVTFALIVAMLAGPVTVVQSSPTNEQPEPGAPVAVAVVVVTCAVGYCVYELAKLCQRRLPKKDTNAPPAEFSAASGDEYGACWNYGALGSCYDDQPYDFYASGEDEPENPTVFNLNVMILPGGVARTSMSTRSGERATQTFAEFQQSVFEHGLFVTGVADGSQYFSRNRIPCDRSLVPITFDSETKSVRHHTGGEMMQVTIERSRDLQNWTSFLKTEASEGSGFQVADATLSGQMFYRVVLSQ